MLDLICPPSEQSIEREGNILVLTDSSLSINNDNPNSKTSNLLLERTLAGLGVDIKHDVYFTSTSLREIPIPKSPLQNKLSTVSIASISKERLIEEIKKVNPKKILALGKEAYSVLAPEASNLSIGKVYGGGFYSPLFPKVYILPTFHPSAIINDIELFRDFRDDIAKFVQSDSVIPSPEIFVDICSNIVSIKECFHSLEQSSFISLDIETTGLDPIVDVITCIGLGGLFELPSKSNPTPQGQSVVFTKEIIQEDVFKSYLYQFLESYQGIIVFHNCKFDLKFLNIFLKGKPPIKNIADTMLMHYLLDERPIGIYSGHSLKTLARRYFDAESYGMEFKKFFESQEENKWDELYTYLGKDVYYTALLYPFLKNKLQEEDEALQILHDELLIPASIALSDIELHGVLIDIPFFQEMKNKWENKETDLLKEIQTIVSDFLGLPDLKFNPNSPKQIIELLNNTFGLSITSSDKVSLETVLRTLKKVEPKTSKKIQLLEKILEFREGGKLSNTFASGLLREVGEDGRIRSDFLLHGTVTGRLSSRNPNLQNIPAKEGEIIRNGFIAPPGYILIQSDYSQLELRVAAWYSQEQGLINAYKQHRDIHAEVAAAIFNKSLPNITKQERSMAKLVTFGILYGRGPRSLVEGVEMDHYVQEGGTRWTMDSATGYIERFFKKYPKLHSWIIKKGDKGIKDHYTRSANGRKRRFPLILGSDGKASAKRLAVNSPVQGYASDLTLHALIGLHNRLPHGAYVLYPVHDSIHIECKEELLSIVIPMIKEEMENNIPIQGDVPFEVEIKTGYRWGSLSPIQKEK